MKITLNSASFFLEKGDKKFKKKPSRACALFRKILGFPKQAVLCLFRGIHRIGMKTKACFSNAAKKTSQVFNKVIGKKEKSPLPAKKRKKKKEPEAYHSKKKATVKSLNKKKVEVDSKADQGAPPVHNQKGAFSDKIKKGLRPIKKNAEKPLSPKTNSLSGATVKNEEGSGEPSKKSDDLSNKLRKEISNQIIKNSSLQEKHQAVFGQLFQAFPKLNKEVSKFKKEHAEKIAPLSKRGWDTLKKEKKEKMVAEGYEAFRNQVNIFINQIINKTLPLFELPEFEMAVFGTPGWNSDVDIGMRSQEGKKLTTGDMVFIKILCDLFTYEIFGGLPGYSLDTEWYIDLRFLSGEVKGTSYKDHFFILEYLMGALQAKEGLSQSLNWHDYKKEELKAESIFVQKNVKQSVFKAIEGWNDQLVKETAAQKVLENSSGPQAHSQAKIVSQWGKLLSLGQTCTNLEKKIDLLEAELAFEKRSPQLKNAYDQLVLAHDLFYSMINSRQPEGTFCWGELQTTLFSAYGQKPQRELEKQAKIFHDSCKGRSFNVQTIEVLRKVSLPQPAKKPKLSQLAVAATERLSLFYHAKEHGTLIEASKYLLRVAEANFYLIEGSYQIPPEKKAKAAEYVEIARALERCKRKQTLNPIVAKYLLHKRLQDLYSEGEASEIGDALEACFTAFDAFKEEKKICLKSEVVHFLTSKLALGGWIQSREIENKMETGKLAPTDHEIYLILRAFAGYKKEKHPELIPLHEQADLLTLRLLALETAGQQAKFCDEFIKFTRAVRDEINKTELIPSSTTKDFEAYFDLKSAWADGGKHLFSKVCKDIPKLSTGSWKPILNRLRGDNPSRSKSLAC